MKKWQIIVASIMVVLVIAVTPLAILAASGDQSGTTSSVPAIQGSLVLVAPRAAYPAQQISTSVFLRADQSVVPDVQIWKIDGANINAYKKVVKSLNHKKQMAVTLKNLPTWLKDNATSIGSTDQNGKLKISFNDAGNYILVAFKDGYLPSVQSVSVRNFLVINGPQNAAPGTNVTFNVTQKENSQPIAGIKVWTVSQSDLPKLKIALFREYLAHKADLSKADWNTVITSRAKLQGTTDAVGTVSATFEKAGKYAVLAVINGKVSGAMRINITNP
jgi:hypothetical protein